MTIMTIGVLIILYMLLIRPTVVKRRVELNKASKGDENADKCETQIENQQDEFFIG